MPVVVVVVVDDVQLSTPLKPFGKSKPTFMWSLLGKEEPGHMTKTVAIPIYGTNI